MNTCHLTNHRVNTAPLGMNTVYRTVPQNPVETMGKYKISIHSPFIKSVPLEMNAFHLGLPYIHFLYSPPRNEYLPPEKPQGQYGPPRNEYGLPNGPPSNNGYGGPPTTGGYSTLPDHILKEYNPPPTAPSGYSTIPDQTPPPPLYDTSQGTGHPAGLYTIEPPKIDILSVPLVSYSHVVNPILEFPPFKKR